MFYKFLECYLQVSRMFGTIEATQHDDHDNGTMPLLRDIMRWFHFPDHDILMLYLPAKIIMFWGFENMVSLVLIETSCLNVCLGGNGWCRNAGA